MQGRHTKCSFLLKDLEAHSVTVGKLSVSVFLHYRWGNRLMHVTWLAWQCQNLSVRPPSVASQYLSYDSFLVAGLSCPAKAVPPAGSLYPMKAHYSTDNVPQQLTAFYKAVDLEDRLHGFLLVFCFVLFCFYSPQCSFLCKVNACPLIQWEKHTTTNGQKTPIVLMYV